MYAGPVTVRSFIQDAVHWQRTGSQSSLIAMLRSPCSGVPHDIGAAYATLGRRTTTLLEDMERGQLALPPEDRDAALCFTRRARRIRSIDAELQSLEESIAQTFELQTCEQPAQRGLPFVADDSFELAEPASLERREGVAGWQKHFSASALNTYAECPRKWFFRYACGAIEDRGSAASAYGSAFHLALEDFHADFSRPSAADEEAMRRRMRQCVTWAFERNRDGFETPVEFELQVRRAQRTAQRYVDWLIAQERDAPFQVIGREVPAELDLEGRSFIGYIDRLDRDDRSGGTSVVDYKTGSIATSAAEYCEDIRRFRDFQLPFYYWARTAAGERVTKLQLIPLKDALLDVRPIVLLVGANIGVGELQRSRARMIELSERLASGNITSFDPTRDAAACEYCAYAAACISKPPAQAQRFGS